MSRGIPWLIRNNYNKSPKRKTNMRELFRKYLDNNCSADEVKRLLAYFNIAENEIVLRRLITEWLENNDDEDGDRLQTNFYIGKRLIKKQLNMQTIELIGIFRKKRVAASGSRIVDTASYSFLPTMQYNWIKNH